MHVLAEAEIVWAVRSQWSRRIDETNRLVYYVTDDHIAILEARNQY